MNMGMQEVQYWIFQKDSFSEHLDRQMYRGKKMSNSTPAWRQTKKSWDNRVFVASSDNAEKKRWGEVFTTPILCLSLLLRLFYSHEGIFAQFGEPGNKVGKFRLAKLDDANFFDQFRHSSVLCFNEGVGTKKQTK